MVDDEIFPEIRLQAGESLFRQGDEGEAMYVLLEGCLAIVQDGVELGTIERPGSFVGELAHLIGGSRLAEVRAATDARLKVVEDMDAFFEAHPEEAIEMARGMGRRLREMDEKFLEVRRRLGSEEGLAKSQVPEDLEFVRRYLTAWRVHI